MARELDFDLGARVRRLLLVLLGLVALHAAAMMAFEGMGLNDALWLTFTTLATVGYGDLSAATAAGRAATVALLYLVGIAVLAQLIGDYIDYRLERRRQMLVGRWRWKMRDHLLIINTPAHGAAEHLELLVRQLRTLPEFGELPVYLLTQNFANGLPEVLRELGVLHRHGEPDNDSDLAAVHPERARYVAVMVPDRLAAHADALVFDTVHRVMQRVGEAPVHVVAECVRDDNRDRLRALGVKAVVRPAPTYPELLLQAMVAPGVEAVMEDMFTFEGDHCQRMPVAIDKLAWADIVNALTRANHGIPLAYVNADGLVDANPEAATVVRAQALIVMVHRNRRPSIDAVRECLAAAAR